jgi:hypothetical protein
VATSSSRYDTPSGSAGTPSPPSNAVDLGHYSYHVQPEQSAYYTAPHAQLHALPRMGSQPTYDAAGRPIEQHHVYGPGGTFAAASYERLKQEPHA